MSEHIEAGSIVEGKVVRIKPFGAIVSIEGKYQGLVHISQISNSFVQNINDHLTMGEIIKVKVLSVDAESGKIALSIKELLPPPEPGFKHKGREPRVNRENREPRRNQEAAAPQGPPPDDFFVPKKSDAAQSGDFEDKMKEWLKFANEKQASLNKRNNKR